MKIFAYLYGYLTGLADVCGNLSLRNHMLCHGPRDISATNGFDAGAAWGVRLWHLRRFARR